MVLHLNVYISNHNICHIMHMFKAAYSGWNCQLCRNNQANQLLAMFANQLL